PLTLNSASELTAPSLGEGRSSFAPADHSVSLRITFAAVISRGPRRSRACGGLRGVARRRAPPTSEAMSPEPESSATGQTSKNKTIPRHARSQQGSEEWRGGEHPRRAKRCRGSAAGGWGRGAGIHFPRRGGSLTP